MSAAARVEEPGNSGDSGLPMRGCGVLAASIASELAFSEAAHPVRHGTLSGADLWAGDAVSFWVDSGFCAAAGLPCEGGEPESLVSSFWS